MFYTILLAAAKRILKHMSLSAVYAVGLYVDPKAAKKLLNSKQAEISAKSGIPEQAIFDGRVVLPIMLSMSRLCQDCALPC